MKNRKIKICLATILRLPFASLVRKHSLFVREKQQQAINTAFTKEKI